MLTLAIRSRTRFLLLMLYAITLTGCVSRRLTVRSDPPGALLEVDGERVGYTPMSIDFTYYATREITLSKVGFEPLTVQQPVPAPWYQKFPLDFASDNFSPVQLTNRHDFTYRLQPKMMVGEEELINRAGEIRNHSQIGSR